MIVVIGSACGASEAVTPVDTVPATSTVDVEPAAIEPAAIELAAIEAAGSDVHQLVYTDVTGADRTVNIEVRQPSVPRASSPVVVWSHGGSTGKRSPAKVGDDWGKAINQAGFVFVAVAHAGRTDDSRRELCAALEVEVCGDFKYLLWDRIRDVQTVFEWLEQASASGELFVDLDRIVYGGHSAGAMAVMTMAGMDSPEAAGLPALTDARPAAFIVASPPGVEAKGVDATSMAGLDRPMLLLTGQGDTTEGTVGSDRLALFELIDSDQVMLISTDSEHVGHTTFDLNSAPCVRAGGSSTECREMVRALGKTAQAFLFSALQAEGLDPDQLIAEIEGRLPAGMELRGAG